MAVWSNNAESLASNCHLPNCSKMVSGPKSMIKKKQELNGAENTAGVQSHLWKARLQNLHSVRHKENNVEIANKFLISLHFRINLS